MFSGGVSFVFRGEPPEDEHEQDDDAADGDEHDTERLT
jgi:hypothetical protein